MAQKFNFDKIDTEGNPAGYVLRVSDSGSAEWAPAVFGSGSIDSIQAAVLYEPLTQNLEFTIAPRVDSGYDIGSRVRPFQKLFLNGKIFLGQTEIRDSSGTVVFVNAKGKEFRIGDFNTQALIDLIDSQFINDIVGDVTGPQGVRGIQGAVGCQGIQGISTQGTTGTIGIQGPTGSSGPQGTRGYCGPQGLTGTIGIQGPQGTCGTQGFEGHQGVQGVQGFPGCVPEPVQGFTGDTGRRGIQGANGLCGPQGPQGIRGTRGPQGIQGLQGLQGITGPQGVCGAQGARGETGNDYCLIQGTCGIQGRAGADGIQGLKGIDGTLPTLLCDFYQSEYSFSDQTAIGQNSNSYQQINQSTKGGFIRNTAIGRNALTHSRIGSSSLSVPCSGRRGSNTAVGYNAGNAFGGEDDVSYSNANVFIGACAASSLNVIDDADVCRNTLIGICAGAASFKSGYLYRFSDNVGIGDCTFQFCCHGTYATTTGLVTKNVAIGDEAGRIWAGNSQTHGCNVDIGVFGHFGANCCVSYLGNVNIGWNYNCTPLGTSPCNQYNVTIGCRVCSLYASFGVGIGRCSVIASNQQTAVGLCSGITTTGNNYYTHIGTCAGASTRNSNYNGQNVTAIGTNARAASLNSVCEVVLGNSSHCALRAAVTTITSLSDCRDKTCIQPIPYGLDFVKALRPVEFQWNRRSEYVNLADSSPDPYQDVHDLGFIAQELRQTEEQFNSTLFTQLLYDLDSNRLEATPHRTYPIMIQAIKDLSDQIDRIKTKIENATAN